MKKSILEKIKQREKRKQTQIQEQRKKKERYLSRSRSRSIESPDNSFGSKKSSDKKIEDAYLGNSRQSPRNSKDSLL